MKRPALLALLIALAGCAAVTRPDYTARYECGGNDFSMVEMNFHRDGKFKIMTGGYDLGGNPVPGPVYRGRYTEGPNTYDLFFDAIGHDTIEKLFMHTTEGGFIRGADTYRINKDPGMLYINNCLLEKTD